MARVAATRTSPLSEAEFKGRLTHLCALVGLPLGPPVCLLRNFSGGSVVSEGGPSDMEKECFVGRLL